MKFDRLAPHYDWMELCLAGGRLQRVRTAWLGELHGCQRILSLGEGHGRFAAACAERFPKAELTCVEESAGMLVRARRRLGPRSKDIRWKKADLLDWEPDGPFDGIATCFFLDCFPPEMLATVISRIANCAAPNSYWLIADFSIPARGLARWRAKAVHSLMYAFFRSVVGLPARRLTSPDALLKTHGYQLVGRRDFDWGLMRADLWRRRNTERPN